MKQQLTAKLKLHTDASQFRALRATQLAYRDALNHVSRFAFEHGKMSNQIRLREETYYEIRAKYGLPAQMATNVPRQVGATYKTLWTRVKQNSVACKAGHTRKRYKGLDHPPQYVSPTLTYNYRRDYSLKPDNQVSILTLSGRVVVSYTGYEKHLAELEVGDPTPEQYTTIVGVDLGMRQLAVTARIVMRHPHSLIGLEDLKNIRERTKRRKGKKASKRQRKANARQSKWAFAELHGMIAYKALLHGSMAIKVDAHHTSQACPMCGHTCAGNRPKGGLLFVCQHCHYTLHADLVGARNITMRTLLARQDWVRTGVLSIRPGSLDPDVPDDEAKAAWRQRYAELRWSPDTSLC